MTGAVERVAIRHLAARRSKTAGEVRFIKDRGGDHAEWAWNPPGASERNIDPDYTFEAKNLKPLAQTLRAALMALGHIQTARTTFTKIRSQTISPDGNLGGKGYVIPVKDIRKMLSNCDEALSAITDCIHDEMQAVHWHPDVQDSGGNPRERDEVKQIMDDVDEIRQDPEDWAEGEEATLDDGTEGATGRHAASKQSPMTGQFLDDLRQKLKVLHNLKWLEEITGDAAKAKAIQDAVDALESRIKGLETRPRGKTAHQAEIRVAARWVVGRVL